MGGLGRDGEAVGQLLARFRRAAARSRRSALTEGFVAHRADDEATLATIRTVARRSASSSTPTPRSASRRPAARRGAEPPVVCLATAHPAKFPDAVERATGVRPPLPARWPTCSSGPSARLLPADLAAVRGYVRDAVEAVGVD